MPLCTFANFKLMSCHRKELRGARGHDLSGLCANTLLSVTGYILEPQTSRIGWLKVTAQEREDYYHESKNLLDQLQLPTEVRYCQNFNCRDDKYLEEIENLYAELTNALLVAAYSAIKKKQVKRMKVNLTFLAGTRWSNQNTKLQRQTSGYG